MWAALLLALLLSAPPTWAQGPGEAFEGVIREILVEEVIEVGGQPQLRQVVRVRITSGPQAGREVTVDAGLFPAVGQPRYRVGDRVVLTRMEGPGGGETYFITDYVRRWPLYGLAVLFAASVLVVGRWRGLASLLGLAYSFLVIFKVVIPLISAGRDPVAVAVLGAVLIIPVTFYLSHGLNRKATVAILGTVLALLLTGLLASFFVEATRLTGFGSEEAAFLHVASQGVLNIRGLVLAGIIISTLGILDDTTVSQAAIVEQLHQARPQMPARELYARSMRVGQDHIASVVNTLVLVYAGASLPLMLLFTDSPLSFTQALNVELVAEEIVRTLVGSVGLVSAVPVTTGLAAAGSRLRRGPPSPAADGSHPPHPH